MGGAYETILLLLLLYNKTSAVNSSIVIVVFRVFVGPGHAQTAIWQNCKANEIAAEAPDPIGMSGMFSTAASSMQSVEDGNKIIIIIIKKNNVYECE
jgi:hypothetical protein